LVGDQITEGVGGIVATETILIRIHLEDIFGPVGIVLKTGNGLKEAGAAAVDKQRGFDPGRRVAEAAEDGRPAVHAVGVVGAKADAQVGILPGDGEAIALAGEEVPAGDEAAQGWRIPVPGIERDPMTLAHGLDGFGMRIGDPAPGGMFIDNEEVAVGVVSGEQGRGIMIEPIIEAGHPFDPPAIRKVIHDVELATKGGEVLAGGDVPIAFQPGALLPAGEVFQREAILRVREGIVLDGGGDEPGVAFEPQLKRLDKPVAEPHMAHAAGVREGEGKNGRSDAPHRAQGC